MPTKIPNDARTSMREWNASALRAILPERMLRPYLRSTRRTLNPTDNRATYAKLFCLYEGRLCMGWFS